MNDLKLKLKNGGLAVGTMISEIRNPNLAYLLAQCGFDFFVIDNEHGSYSPETISNMIAAARGAGGGNQRSGYQPARIGSDG